MHTKTILLKYFIFGRFCFRFVHIYIYCNGSWLSLRVEVWNRQSDGCIGEVLVLGSNLGLLIFAACRAEVRPSHETASTIEAKVMDFRGTILCCCHLDVSFFHNVSIQ